jgi:type I restriction enzyme S subunit
MQSSKLLLDGKNGARNGWRLVTFGEMAENIGDRVDNPSEAGVDRYVGLEHLDPQSLKIRRWGTPDQVEATKLRFKPGDIIFGKRRAYQRKLAVADFEGICSAHAMVLRAREDTVVKDFLPVFMQSEVFFERALAISVGSLSPTINWKTLATQEFSIPPRDEQQRIAEILWAADEQVQALRRVNNLTDTLLQAFVEKFLAEEPGESKPCSDLIVENVRNGFSPPTSSRGLPTLSISAIREGQVRCEPDNIKYADVPLASVAQFLMKPKDVLVVRGNGNRDLVGRAGIVSTNPENCFYPDLLIRLRFDESKIRPEFACIQWNSRTAHGQLLKRAKSTNGIWKVNGKDVSQQLLKVPKLKDQDNLLRQLQQFDGTIRSARSALETAHFLGTWLLQQLLSPGNTS